MPTQPPLRLGIRPRPPRPPTWQLPSSAGEDRHTAADLHTPIRRLLMNPVATDRTGMKENTPMRELFRGTVKYYSPRHAQRHHFSTVLSTRGRFLFQRGVIPRTRAPCWGGISFTRTRLGRYFFHQNPTGAVFLSPEPDWASDPSPAARSTRPVAVSCGRGPLARIGDRP